MSRLGYFYEELRKVAFSMKAPSIPTSIRGITTKSGNNVVANATTRSLPSVKPAISPAKNLASKGAKAVPTAGGKNLGSKVTPRRKTVPPVNAGGSLVR